MTIFNEGTDLPLKIYISGVHSSANPSPGVGVARSLRIAYPDATLIAVDFSIASTGIHYDCFDTVWMQRPWNELDLRLYASQILQLLQGESLWISCLDLEVEWLAQECAEEPRVLVPPSSAIELTTKPAIPAARKYLPVSIPDSIPVTRPAWEQYDFCRRNGWPIWCKGPKYEARCCYSWREVLESTLELQETWASQNLFLQTNVLGHEESIAFCAYKGLLVDCVYMEKRSQTAEGKVWAGRITEVDSALQEALRRLVAELEWSGGAELELIRDERGGLYLIEWNPRFPAWIHGATLAGHNLPAELVEAAGLGKAVDTPAISQEFVRVVLEIPARPGYCLPRLAPIKYASGTLSKHPSGMPLLARRFGGIGPRKADCPKIPQITIEDLADIDIRTVKTPRRCFLPRTAKSVFEKAQDIKERGRDLGVTVDIAYSVKTNPDPILMTLARNHGMCAEAITSLEIEHAASSGFPPNRIIVNGPAQFWPNEILSRGTFKAVFADSLERLARVIQQSNLAKFLGVRLRPPSMPSRFGVDLQDPEAFFNLVDLLRKTDLSQGLGIHFHISSDVVGTGRWWEIYQSMLHWAEAIEASSGRIVGCVDVGGGWFPEDLVGEFAVRLPKAIEQAKRILERVQVFLLEPGKALAQPCVALLTRVLEVRRSQRHLDVVVDCATSDLPMASFFPHRIVALRRDNSLEPLPNGDDQILGRNCMESDIITEHVSIPAWLVPGNVIAICDAGAYDTSMAYDFGRGRTYDG